LSKKPEIFLPVPGRTANHKDRRKNCLKDWLNYWFKNCLCVGTLLAALIWFYPGSLMADQISPAYSETDLAWWSIVSPKISPFGPYDYFSSRVFKLSSLRKDFSPSRPEVLVKISPLILSGHRPVGLSESSFYLLEPIWVRDPTYYGKLPGKSSDDDGVQSGAWYLTVWADTNARVEIFSRFQEDGRVLYAQTEVNLYPAKPSGKPALPRVGAPSWPVLKVIWPASPARRLLAGTGLTISFDSSVAGSTLILNRGEKSKMCQGDLNSFTCLIADDPKLNRLGPGAAKEVVVAVLPTLSADAPMALTFSFEVFRNQPLHSSQFAATLLLVLTGATATIFTLLFRRRFEFEH
jgi:hypothetical protein